MAGIASTPFKSIAGGSDTLAKIQLLQNNLDQPLMADMTSSWMDANAGSIVYNGGREVKIARIETSGLMDYNRKSGYSNGTVSMGYESFEMNQDRGTKFVLDAMDIDESSFIPNAARVIGTFQKESVAPEIDAYRYSKVFDYIAHGVDYTSGDTTKSVARSATYNTARVTVEDTTGATPTNVLTQGNIMSELIADINKVYDETDGAQDLVITMPYTVFTLLQQGLSEKGQIRYDDFKGMVNTKVAYFNDVPIMLAPSKRLMTKYDFLKGNETGQNSGFKVADGAEQIQWLITPRRAPLAVTKADTLRIFSPDQYQSANAWCIDYRRFHDLWITESMIPACRARIKKLA